LPIDETCNDLDDDCDGKTDEDVTLGSCPGSGVCGGVLHCDHGQPVCDAKTGPTPEVCNGVDDDCDGVIDNGADVPCYPDGQTGCTKRTDGTYMCTGLCKAGTAVCQGGKLADCANYVLPSAEICGQADAADEDCNGKVDDGCPCQGNATQSCYSGPLFTRNVGICHAGTQHCVNSAWGDCQGEVDPGTETCQNQGSDDDCNFITDDVFLVGVVCLAFGAQGACSTGSYACRNGGLVCMPGIAQSTETACDGVDEDCDGKTDENWDFNTDTNNCGGCGNACGNGQLCCNGSCHNPSSDGNNCGTCGHSCGGSTQCCGGSCVSTDTRDHCGGCGGCGTGQACCGGNCVDTTTTDHCGGCGGCSTGQACCGGSCVDTSSTDHCGGCGGCGAGQACCGGACVDTTTMDHCGGCAACTGVACCGGQCVQAENTPDHCGSCGGCASGNDCCNGKCVPNGPGTCSDCTPCGTGQTCCSGSCVTPAPDAGTSCP
jgi:hypothetical protein